MTDVQRNGHRLSIPLAMAIGLGSMVATAGVSWGVYSRNVDDLQREQQEQSRTVRQHETKIAVLESKLDTIIGQLAEANARLARLEGRQ